MKYISPWYYGNEAIEIVQWQNEKNITCGALDIDMGCLQTGEQVLTYYSMDKVILQVL